VSKYQSPSENQDVASAPAGAAISSDLVNYNTAKKALAEAHRVDEVKDIRDKADAMRLYAMQAKDVVLINHATEIRLRAERRAGELLKEMDKHKGARGNGPGRGIKKAVAPDDRVLDKTPKLRDLNITKSQSSKWQQLAGIPDDDFEQVVAHAKQKACDAVDRAQQPNLKSPPMKTPPKKRVVAAVPEPPGPAPDQAPEDIIKECALYVGNMVRGTLVKLEREDQRRLLNKLRELIDKIATKAAEAE
jgi:hypothetical protein